jgi:transposase
MGMDEAELRRHAMEMLREGHRPGEVARELGRSRQWLAKWRQRFDDAGKAGLRERSRAHRGHPQTTPERIVRAVLAARDRLARHHGRQRFAGSGADAVAWELELAGVRPLPARRTIERILQRAGKTVHPAAPVAHEHTGGAYPAPRAERPGDLQQSDLVGPRHLRGRSGPLRFYALHTVDVGGGGIATWQAPDKSATSFCHYLIEIAWARLGLPLIWQLDNEIAVGGFPGKPFTQTVRLALLLGVEVRFIPQGEPGRNADIESFNALWQARVLRRFTTPSLVRLAAVSARFERWFMDERPHPKLSLAVHGTRFPGVLLKRQGAATARIPAGFSLQRYRDAAGELRLPLARGRISWVRRADERGNLGVMGRRLPLGQAAANEYAVATLSTARGDIAVHLANGGVKLFASPMKERVVQPLRRGGR